MYKRTIQSRRQKRTYRGGVDIDDPYDKADLSSVEHASKPVSPSANPENKKKRGRSSESDREQTDQSRPQPAAKRLKLDGEHDSQAEASDKQSTDTEGDSASHQLEFGSSDDALYSSSEADSDSESPPIFIHCGYLQSTTDTSNIIPLRMNPRKGEFQLLRIGTADNCEIYLDEPEVALWHCVIRLVLSVSDEGPVLRQVLVRALKTVPEAQTMITSGGQTFRLKPEFVELQQHDLICFGNGSLFRLSKAEFHQLYHYVDIVQDGRKANSRVARVRRGHDGVVCVAKTITGDHAGMAVTELLAYTELRDYSNIVRVLECFYDETFYDYHLVLEEATTDLDRFVNLMRPRSQADLRTAASVWTKAMTSAINHLHDLGMSHRDMKPSNILVFLTEGLIDVKLADFGLARLGSQRVESNWSGGTLGWMAPAAFREHYDDRLIDCYGVGRVLFFILTHHEWPSEASVPTYLCGCAHGCPEVCVKRESEFRHIKQSGANADSVSFLRKVLVGSPEMCMESKDMVEHSYVSYVPLESEQARIDSAIARLYSRFNRLSRGTYSR